MSVKSNKTVPITPIGDRVLLQRIEPSEEIKGGIVIPDSAKEKPTETKVLALGSGKRMENGERVAFEVKAGDRVLISKYGGTEVSYQDEKYLIISEDDILAILN